VRDLNYQLKQLCHRNRDGSYITQAKRMHHLMLIADQLYGLGFRGMKPRSLQQKQVDTLVKDWRSEQSKTGWRSCAGGQRRPTGETLWLDPVPTTESRIGSL
jgi:hypothetical protein